MIKIGQIGIGHNHGEEKMRTVRKFPELFEVVGYAEENEEWVAKRGNLAGYQGLPRLTVDEVIARSDAVLIETDVWNLTETAQKCIDAGKHIHLDKPASGTLAEYKHLLDTAREKHLVVQLGYMYRYNPVIRQLMDQVKAGELGTVYSINAEMSTRHSDEYRTWLRHFEGGNMYIFGSHLLDLIILMLGEPKKVMSNIGMSGMNGVYGPDLSAATLVYDNALARIFVSSVETNGWGRRTLSVAGSAGTAEIRPLEVPTRMTLAKQSEIPKGLGDFAKPVDVYELPNSMRYDDMMTEFYDCVTGKKENPYTYDHEYTVQKVLQAIIDSSDPWEVK